MQRLHQVRVYTLAVPVLTPRLPEEERSKLKAALLYLVQRRMTKIRMDCSSAEISPLIRICQELTK